VLNYHLTYAVLGDFYLKLEHFTEAKIAFNKALTLTSQDAEKRFLEKRIKEIP
jgi:RNA polymerase sigma-70 factor (ECF subfamily)